MAIQTSIQIPFDVDVKNETDLKNFLIIIKQYVEELAQKGQEA